VGLAEALLVLVDAKVLDFQGVKKNGMFMECSTQKGEYSKKKSEHPQQVRCLEIQKERPHLYAM
jgi:hypothetical protein